MTDRDNLEITIGELTLIGSYSFAIQEGKEATVRIPGLAGQLKIRLVEFAGSGTPSMDWELEDDGLTLIIKHIAHTQYMTLMAPACVAIDDADPTRGYWIQGKAIPFRKPRSVFMTLALFSGPPPEHANE